MGIYKNITNGFMIIWVKDVHNSESFEVDFLNKTCIKIKIKKTKIKAIKIKKITIKKLYFTNIIKGEILNAPITIEIIFI